MGSTWGNNLKISIFGESHGIGIGGVIDGFPAGFSVDMEHILFEMSRRAPGSSSLTTNRKEADVPEIISGIFEGVTTGAPICAIIKSTDIKSQDYKNLRDVPRPSHSEFTGNIRYKGFNDIRGGGHFSGRLMAPLVFAGALCKDYLRRNNKIEIGSHLYSIGNIKDRPFDLTLVTNEELLRLQKQMIPVLEDEVSERIKLAIETARMDQDSIGGVIECAANGINGGLGSPIFANVESRISSLIFGIPAVKGIEFGMGFEISEKKGKEVNDCFVKSENSIKTKTNYNGGILGGITTGMPLVLRVAFKPTPSISSNQSTLNMKTGKEENLIIKGRHDPCIALRCSVIVEAAVAIAIMDLYLEAYGYDPR